MDSNDRHLKEFIDDMEVLRIGGAESFTIGGCYYNWTIEWLKELLRYRELMGRMEDDGK